MEQVEQLASFIYNRAPGILPVISSVVYAFFFLIICGHSNVHIPMIFARGLLLGEASGSIGIPEEMKEVLAPVLETPIIEEEMRGSVPNPEVVSTKKENEHSIPIPEAAITQKEMEPAHVPI